jgi:transcriptional regulator with XRE-family HTH domain
VPKPSSLPALFAARLVQARQLRELSQRALGDRVGLGKATGSTRINRYERGVSSPGLAGLEALAVTLDVPAAFLLAESAEMAEAILAFAELSEAQQAGMARALRTVEDDPELLNLLAQAANYEQAEWEAVVARLKQALRRPGSGKG